jgi:L-2-hydroxyglutarate oxidase LhgO
METVNITIIGAGVVGLAIAAELSKKHDSVVLLEKHEKFGQETSSRNSEVIHSGLYYPAGSLKTRLCIDGAARLYDLAMRHAIPHKRIGKLIIATEQSELPALDTLYAQGQLNGVQKLALLGKDETRKIEPNTNAIAAIYSSGTGIIDSHGLMRHFYNEAVSRNTLVSFLSEVTMIERQADNFLVSVKGEDYRFLSRVVINCAGLAADRIAGMAGLNVSQCGYRIHYCKGSYFSYSRSSPIHTLVYPVPHEHLAGLGVHATLDLGGRLRFGPDAEYVDDLDYTVKSDKQDQFYKGALKIIPGLERDSFLPDMAGIRPKLSGKGELARDFIISEESSRGLPGLINLIGIESPGLTASPAIASMVSVLADSILC